MIKYTRCQECKSDTIAEVADSLQKVTCKYCGNRSSFYVDLTDSHWAQEKIAEWVASKGQNKPPKFFDEDGDPVMELSNAIYDMEAYIDRWVKSFVDKGMSAMELRGMTERLMNAVHVACMSHINRTEKGWPGEA